MKTYKDISYGNLPEQKLDIYIPDCDNFDLFIYFHGGGIEGGTKETTHFLPTLIEKGIAVISADYRLYPTAVYPEFIRDAAAVVAWATQHIEEYGHCKKIFVGGSSAGGYISMMLCFDKKYLAPYGIDPLELGGFIHNSGQTTVHFNILRERGFDSRRVIIDEAAPIYHIGTAEKYAPMLFVVADNDIENRYEETQLMISTIKHFGYDMSKIKYQLMHSGHCQYNSEFDENGKNLFGNLIIKFIDEFR